MRKTIIAVMMVLGTFVVLTFLFSTRPERVLGQGNAQQNHSQSDQEVSGPYDVVKDWPKPMATLFPAEKG